MVTDKEEVQRTFSLLDAWLTEEVLAPQAVPTARDLQPMRRELVRFDEYEEPWSEKKFHKRGMEKSIYWMIYLGQIDLQKAMQSILKQFPDEYSNEKSTVKGNTTMAVLVLDEQGRPVSDSIFLSSFAWGYGKVLNNQLNELATFEESQRILINSIGKLIIRQNEDGEILPIQYSDIKKLVIWLINALNIPQDEVYEGFSIRVPQYSYKEVPQPELLNSFFIEDLISVKKALRDHNMGKALSLYMGIIQPKPQEDINKDKKLLAQILSPQQIPLTRWPGKDKHPLYLMQQAAVNHISNELNISGIVAVNGPPGTGKTTLLRDIIAKVVLDRAIALSKFENPSNAFQHLTSIKLGKSYSHIYTLDESLLGHEIIIASSNNKAVENISKEIPSASAVADDVLQSLRYFRTISDVIASDSDKVQRDSTWGLAAAVLGNSTNKNAFVNKFWWDKDNGMGVYLKSIVDGIQVKEDISEDEDEPGLESHVPFIVENEAPPLNETEAMERWKIARKDFEIKYRKAKQLREMAQEVNTAMIDEENCYEKCQLRKLECRKANDVVADTQNSLDHVKALYDDKNDEYLNAKVNNEMILKMKPGFFARLFNTQTYKDWYSKSANAYEAMDKFQKSVKEISLQKRRIEDSLKSAQKEFANAKSNKEKAEAEFEYNQKIQRIGREKIGQNIADSAFWTQSDDQLQQSNPWLFEEFQQARDELFISAFKLLRAFIDASAKQMRHNLSVALEILKGRQLSDKQEVGRQSLWASLFMVVPVISTTLASVSRMFGRLGKEQLGWLLIDESGQATPQSVIGAMWRSKRVVVIGDPLQIEPVVTMPPKLIKSIFANFKLPYEDWAAPTTSAQEIADRSSWVGTLLSDENGDRWVGSPLRVHRRCENPMFSISNKIAYDNLMIYATPKGHSEIGSLLGNSCWINVQSDCTAKWSSQEGQVVLQILKKIKDAGITEPDIFIITPFRNVAFNLRDDIRKSHILTDLISTNINDWVNERVGTIHTFQGKEAGTVVIILGASDDASSGARIWAGSSPNLLNVAVTRAKHSLYVVGSREAWDNVGCFKVLSKYLKVRDFEYLVTKSLKQ